jgi:hypothetical protein
VDERWDGDERGRGIAGAPELAAQVDDLARQMRDPGWLTEDARVHLGHHLERACGRPGSGVSLVDMREADGVLHVSVRMIEHGTYQDVRGAAMALVGHVLEGATFVRERRAEAGSEFEVATAMMPGEGGFAGHGHLLRISVEDAPP